MTEFIRFLAEQRRKLYDTTAKLASATDIHPATLHKYLSGERAIPDDRAAKLRSALCRSDPERAMFDALQEQTGKRKGNSPLDLRIDSSLASLRVAPLASYSPFSGNNANPKSDEYNVFNEAGFVDQFLRGMMDLAGIRFQIPEVASAHAQVSDRTFAIKQRLNWIEDGQVDVLLNLVSLQRMRKLHFLFTPIRIGLNAVISRAHQRDLNIAEQLLTKGIVDPASPFRVLAIKHEVGHSFLEQLGDNLVKPTDIVDTLDAKVLATRLRNSKSTRLMLVCDEHTAMNVIEAMEGDGILVLPPNTDQAIIHSDARRIPPAHYFGMGLRRQNNWALISYLMEASSAYLNLESESIAALYEKLYHELVNRYVACLKETDIFVGGVRRIVMRVEGKRTLNDSDEAQRRIRLALVEQNARAVARRSLSLSRRALEHSPNELLSWRKVVHRTRERILIADAGDRNHVRNIILVSARTALGVEPLKDMVVSPKTTSMEDPRKDLEPFELLKRLKSAAEGTEPDTNTNLAAESDKKPEEAQEPDESWDNFIFLLERELDISLQEHKTKLRLLDYDYGILGRMISAIQRILEESEATQILPRMKSAKADDQKIYNGLWKQYSADPEMMGRTENLMPVDLANLQPIPLENGDKAHNVVILAINLGEPVGFIQGVIEPYSGARLIDNKERANLRETLRVDHIYVVAPMRNMGMSRRLIRRLIEHANSNKASLVWLDPSHFSKETLSKFTRSGFTYSVQVTSPDRELFYELLACKARD